MRTASKNIHECAVNFTKDLKQAPQFGIHALSPSLALLMISER